MGVRRSDYILIGANIGYEHYHDDKYKDYEQYYGKTAKGELTYLVDGYGGDYFIVGEVIAADKDGYDGLSLTTVDLFDFKYTESMIKVEKHIKEKFDLDVDTQLIILTHWR